MSRIRMYVYVHNESDAVLELASREVLSGEFTERWEPPTRISPGETGKFQGEGDLLVVPTTGTEGNVRYQINASGGGELYIHWNSPLVESQYGNTFHVWCPPGWDVIHWGGQGHEAELHIRLRRTAIHRVPNFNPAGRGFAFLNSWRGDLPVVRLGFILKRLYDNDNCLGGIATTIGQLTIDLATAGISRVVIAAIDDDFGPPLTNTSAGMCGGMVYTVMDYFANHQLPPTTNVSPSSADDPLFIHIRQRLMDSFDINGDGCRFLAYSLPTYPNGDEGFVQAVGIWKGRSWIAYREAVPQIQADIDAGRLSPIGLIQTDSGDIGQNHQVLAYGYRRNGQDVTLFIYDPNEGQKEVTFDFNITHTDGEVHINRRVNGREDNRKRIWGFFRINGYSPQVPPGGRRIQSLKDAVLAASPELILGDKGSRQISVRPAVTAKSNSASVLSWMRSL